MDIKYKLDAYGELEDYGVCKFHGNDTLSFLQGQTTADLGQLEHNTFIINTRLKRTGQLKFFFFTAYLDGAYYIIARKETLDELTLDLNNFIIMEDVEIEHLSPKVLFSFSPKIKDSLKGNYVQGFLYGEEGIIFWDLSEFDKGILEKYDDLEVDKLFKLNGYSEIFYQNKETLINETIFNISAISYKKGCFLGSETVSKIENGRGGAYFPVLLKCKNRLQFKPKNGDLLYVDNMKMGEVFSSLEDQDVDLICVKLFRQYRVNGLNLNILINGNDIDCSVYYYPYFKDTSWKEKSLSLYDKGMKAFIEDLEEEAKSYLQDSLVFNPQNADACETLGVIYGRHEEYELAISLMDKLLLTDPNSVMAHTNKSLYLMKLGKIDEAEEEKSKATIKSFEKFGDEAQRKEQEELSKKKAIEEIDRRKGMFLQVLDIDSEDLIANLGMADIKYKEDHFEESLKYLETVEKIDKKNTQFLMLKAKNYEMLGEIDTAITYLNNGIKEASLKGEMKLANEMQANLIHLRN